MKTKRMMRVLSLLAALAMIAALVTGCGPKNDGGNGGGSDVQGQTAALSEEEYMGVLEDIMTKYAAAVQDMASIDANDPESAKNLFNATKAPFEDFLKVTAPEKYAEADAKMKAGCQAWNDFIDLSVVMMDETDQTKLAEYATQAVELTQSVQKNFQEAADLLEAAG